jgi:hypothetical protein
MLSACGSKVPQLARDLPSTYTEGEKVFDARLKAKFPPGTDEDKLVEALSGDGFKILVSPTGRFATFSDGRFPVASVWNIGWKTDAGKVTEIWGVYGGRGP